VTHELLSIDPGLLARFRAAGAKISWRPAEGRATRSPRRTTRIAHLNDEDARVEAWGRPSAGGLEVDAGPLGALVLLLEADQRGSLPRLESRNAGVDPGFAQGAIRASWGKSAPVVPGPTIPDLVELARYALA
jgi:hypothetical protein